jgi:hypothetical protein
VIQSVLIGALGAGLGLACSSKDDESGGSASASGTSNSSGGSNTQGGSSTSGGSSADGGASDGSGGDTDDQLYGWTVDTTLLASYDIQALWGSGSGDIWAAAGGGDLFGGAGQIHHYGGTAWELFYSMGTPGLLDVFGLKGGSDVFFVGHGPQFYQLTPTDITLLEGQTGGSAVADTAVWASAPDAVWVGSASTSKPLRFWNGEMFVDTDSRYRSPNLSGVTAVWGSSASDVWAADGEGILHFDGDAWTQSYSSTSANFWGIDGSGPNDVWAVGPRALVHFDGQSWKPQADGMDKALNGLWVAGPNDVCLVGDDGRILHGGTSGLNAVPSGITDSLFAIWGSGPHDIWAGGAGGTLIHYGPVSTPTMNPDMPDCSPQGYGCSMTPCCSPFRCTNIGGGILACG